MVSKPQTLDHYIDGQSSRAVYQAAAKHFERVSLELGGFKHSGIGRENGQKAIMEYLEAKSVFINAKRGIASPFVMSTPE